MKKKLSFLLREFAPEGITLVILVAIFWFFMKMHWVSDRGILMPYMWISMIAICVGTLILALCKKLSAERLTQIILFAGLAMRIGFILYKPSYASYHDLGEITTEGYYGHASYILKIFETNALPLENYGQYYHPPFFHILSACTMKITCRVLKIYDVVYLFESSKIISGAATCFILIASHKILKELNLGKIATVIALAVCAFLPVHYLLGGWVNNDALVTMFMTWIILYTIRWYKNPNYFNIFMLAISFGFGIFTKISCALFAFFTGAFMLVKLIEGIKARDWKRYVAQFALFSCIAFPIGLFFPIRNYLLFDQGLNFVLVPGENIYCGDHGFVERFITFPIHRLLDPICADPFNEYNLNFYLIKTAAIGEFTYNHVEQWPAAIIIVCNLILVVQAVLSTIIVCVKERKSSNVMLKWGLPGLWLWIYFNHVLLNIRIPYGCTMDFRYIIPTALLGAIYLGIYVEDCMKNRSVWRWVFAGVCCLCLILMTVAGMYMFSNVWKF